MGEKKQKKKRREGTKARVGSMVTNATKTMTLEEKNDEMREEGGEYEKEEIKEKKKEWKRRKAKE